LTPRYTTAAESQRFSRFCFVGDSRHPQTPRQRASPHGLHVRWRCLHAPRPFRRAERKVKVMHLIYIITTSSLRIFAAKWLAGGSQICHSRAMQVRWIVKHFCAKFAN
jgi:hypothetical protein